MSSDPEQEYFAGGMVAEIITAPSRFKSLLVIARNSSFTFKGRAVDIKEVGPAGEVSFPFKTSGNFARAGKQPLRFTRVRGAIYIGEVFASDYSYIDHFALLVRNPNVPLSLPTDMWADIPFFPLIDGRCVWSDTGKGGL